MGDLIKFPTHKINFFTLDKTFPEHTINDMLKNIHCYFVKVMV